MTRFTDSPYEYMMTQKPEAGLPQESEARNDPSKNLCGTCPYGRGRPCVSVYMKKLLSVAGKRRRKTIETDT